MIVARSSAATSGWGIFSRLGVRVAMPAEDSVCYLISKSLEMTNRQDVTRVLQPTRPRLLSRRVLSPRAAYGLMAAVIGLALLASGTPTPLYGTYGAMWALSPGVLTLVYAVDAAGVLATLLLAGPVSDSAGRRPVLLVALGALMSATVIFMLADSVAWLFAARAVQGLATGLALSAASAALLDLHPHRDPHAGGLL